MMACSESWPLLKRLSQNALLKLKLVTFSVWSTIAEKMFLLSMCKFWSAFAFYFFICNSFPLKLWCFQKVFCVQQWIGQASSFLKKRYFHRNRYFYIWTLPSQTATKAPSLPPIFSWVQLLSTHALQLQVTKPKTATACAVSPLPSLPLLCGTSP